MVLFVVIRRKLYWMVHLSQHLSILYTFLCVVILGGIPYSGGIFLAALNAVIFSILFYNVSWSVWYFVLFGICTVAAYFIQSVLQIPPEMSPEINDLLTLLNTLFISGYTLVIVLTYLRQYSQLQKNRADRLKELDEIKSKFYTNITHEFRTPITVILGAAEQIENKNYKGIKSLLEKIRQNSENLLSLVSQMLNLSKLEAGVMPVNYVRSDIIRFVRYVSESFEILCREQKLSFNFRCQVSTFEMDYDPEKLTQIISNLLINAIKFTPERGKVELTIIPDEEKQRLEISISDTGPGIPEDKINRVFDRFYHFENETNAAGSGLGLSITRELVHLLKGNIKVESKPGSGTTFNIELPVTKLAKPVSHIEQEWATEFFPEKHSEIKSKSVPGSNTVSTVLVIEDNQDVTDYICSLLVKDYKISTAKNGIEGLANALKTIPDIIISDIMMPEMDGIEMLKQLKADIRTSHIPVILLTAKADMESKIEGISTGAEAYLSKPFNKEELFARITTLIRLRKELQKKYSIPDISLNVEVHHQNIEDSFMSRINNFLNKNIDNEEIAVSDICNAMNMSRSQLYRKFGALTNRSVSDYFRSFRLQKAKQILQSTELNVTQVAFEVGFKNLSHFSKSFLNEFGVTPSQTKK